MTLLPMALLFVPIALGLESISTPGPTRSIVSASEALRHKKRVPEPAVRSCVRAGVYFAIWIVLAVLLNRWSRPPGRERRPAPPRRLQAAQRAGPGRSSS